MGAMSLWCNKNNAHENKVDEKRLKKVSLDYGLLFIIFFIWASVNPISML